jgi:RNase H-like domain found in reverse transcriptase
METITILEALLKWEDELLGNRINIVTNHRALEKFKTQRRLSHRQMRWMEYLSRFDFDIQYVKGVTNKVADSLSWYYQSDMSEDSHPNYDFVNADVKLDPEGEDLPWNRVVEIRAICDDVQRRPLWEATKEQGTLAEELANATRAPGATQGIHDNDDDPTIFESISNGPELRKHIEKATDFLERVRAGYSKDPLFSKIVAKQSHYSTFEYRDGLLYT